MPADRSLNGMPENNSFLSCSPTNLDLLGAAKETNGGRPGAF
jgi:hypothetical protein